MTPLTAVLLAMVASSHAYWLMGIENFITTERIDPLVNPGAISGHVHSVLGGSNFRFNTDTASLRNSECTSIPIPEDKSSYWFPHLYFQWANGSFTNVNGGAVIYYLFADEAGKTTAFPDDFRMLTGDPTLRTYDPNSHAQQAVTFLCLDFKGETTRHNNIPKKACPSGIRSQVNFPSCWDGKNLDSANHKSHVAFPSGGPDSGSCSDPKYPVTIPRIFIEVYWASNDFEKYRSQAKDQSQPFVFSYGDPTGYGWHADFINGWDRGVLQNAVDKCHCNIYGDPTCCVNQGIFHMTKGKKCHITKSINERTTGMLPTLPGNNPVQPEGKRATMYMDTNPPSLISPVYVYTGDSPNQTGTIVLGGPRPTSSSAPQSSSSSVAVPPTSVPVPSSSSVVVTPPYIPSSSSVVAVPSSSIVALPSSSSVVVAPPYSSAVTLSSSVVVAPPSSSSVIVPSVTSVVHVPHSTSTSTSSSVQSKTTEPAHLPTFSLPTSFPSFTFSHLPHNTGGATSPSPSHPSGHAPNNDNTGKCKMNRNRKPRSVAQEQEQQRHEEEEVQIIESLDKTRQQHSRLHRRFTNHY